LPLASPKGEHQGEPQFVGRDLAERLDVFGLPDDFRAVDARTACRRARRRCGDRAAVLGHRQHAREHAPRIVRLAIAVGDGDTVAPGFEQTARLGLLDQRQGHVAELDLDPPKESEIVLFGARGQLAELARRFECRDQ
jgi:hypothetical protein